MNIRTIVRSDIGNTVNGLRIQERDVGKRVHKRNGIYQAENDEQVRARVKRTQDLHPGKLVCPWCGNQGDFTRIEAAICPTSVCSTMKGWEYTGDGTDTDVVWDTQDREKAERLGLPEFECDVCHMEFTVGADLFLCCVCGSNDVQESAWFNPNTRQVAGNGPEGPCEAAWCEDCQEHVGHLCWCEVDRCDATCRNCGRRYAKVDGKWKPIETN